jgi:uncharacterized protein (TIGR02996 family)
MMPLEVLVRADAPAYTVAQALVSGLGFRLIRGINRSLRLWRAGPDGRTVLTVADHRSGERLWAGYDVEIAGDFEDELLAWELFGQLRALGLPALLRQESRVMLAWSPHRGPRTARTDHDDPAAWEDYVLPPVGAAVAAAPDDVLGRTYAGILADPDDDVLRLSYADAVAPDHPEYAQLIRLQVGRIRSVEIGELIRRLHGDVGPLELRGLIETYQISRGFVETVSLRAETFVDAAARLVAAVPLRMVRLTGVPEWIWPQLAALPELGRLRGLSLDGCAIGDDGLGALLTSPHLTGLRWLDLRRTGVTERGVELLAAADATPALRYVHADVDLRLNPEAAYDWTGALVWTNPATLAESLGRRYPAPWLHRGGQDLDVPSYDEV